MNSKKYLIIGLITIVAFGLGCVNNTSPKSEAKEINGDKYILIEYSGAIDKTFGTNIASEGKQYLIIKVNIQNHGYESFDTHEIQWSLTYNNVKGYKSTIDNMPTFDILDGGKTEGILVFEVPESSTYTYTINYRGVKGGGIIGKMRCLATEGDKCYIDYNIRWKNIGDVSPTMTVTNPVETTNMQATIPPPQEYCGYPNTNYSKISSSDIYGDQYNERCVTFTARVSEVLQKWTQTEGGEQIEISAFNVLIDIQGSPIYVSIPTDKIIGTVNKDSIIEVKGKISGRYSAKGYPVVWAQGIKPGAITVLSIGNNVPIQTSSINKVIVEHYEKSVDKLTRYISSDGPEYQYPNPGMTFLIMNLKITNQGYPSVKIDKYSWYLKVSTKDNPNAYTEVDKIFYGEEDGIECRDTELENGGWMLCKIAFDVPKDHDQYKITWSDYSNKNIEWKYIPN